MGTTIFAIVLGLLVTYVGWSYAALARKMRSYKSVPGRVISRAVALVPSGNTRTGVWGQGGGYTPQITYRYTVDGVVHESKNVARAVRGYKERFAQAKLDSIPDDVVVWYDPKNPAEAYLEKHGQALGIAILALGIAFLTGAGIALVSRF